MTDSDAGQARAAGRTDRLHLSPRHREKLEALLREHLPGIEAWAYGSRVNGDSHDGSDLDLALRAPDLQEIPAGPLADFREALHDSTLPFLVEARDWARLPERFHREIEREYVVLVEDAWGQTSFSDLIDIKHGFAFKGAFIREEECGDIMLTPGNFAIGGGFKDNKFKYYDGSIPEEFILSSGDLLVTMTDLSKQADTLGYPAIIPKCPEGRRYLHNQRLGKVVIRDKSSLNARYLYYVMCSAEYRHEVLASATGTTVKHTSPERIKRFCFFLPPLPEQRAIAHILGALDDKIELNRRMNETLEGMAQALFKDWFVDFGPVRAKMEGRWRPGQSLPGLPAHLYDLFPDRLVDSELGEAPEGWEWSKIGTKVETKLGGTPSRKQPTFWDGNVPWINSGKANEFRVISPSEYITTEGFARSATKLLPKRTTLIAITGATLGQVSLTEIETCANQSIIGVIGNEEISNEFLYFWIIEYINHLLALQTGAAQQHINKGNVDNLILLLPGSEMMESWVNIARPIFNKIAMGCFENENLTQTRNILLPKLVSGEIRIRDAKQFVERII